MTSYFSVNWLVECLFSVCPTDTPGIPELQRQHDQYLMDMVLSNPKWKPAHIKRINWCHLYLNVTTLSDITNVQGNQIDPGIYNGNLDSVQAKYTWQCVNQKKPNNSSWKVWRQFCRSFSTPAPCHRYRLHQPLGDWIIPESQMRRQWPYWYDPIQQLLLGIRKSQIPKVRFQLHWHQ